MEEIRKLTVTGSGPSYYVTLPKDMIRKLGWKKGQKLVVGLDRKKIHIQDYDAKAKKKR